MAKKPAPPLVLDPAGIATCQLCSLADGKPVPGEGPMPARIMVVGEAPGAEEAATGRPFVGRSGKLLDKLLVKAGINRADVFVTNVLKHRPPNNRPPKAAEIKACLPYLRAQIDGVQPVVVVTLGAPAAKAFYPKTSLLRDHGKPRTIVAHGRTLIHVPMYHPSAGLRDPNKRLLLVSDFAKLELELAAMEAQAPPDPEYRLASGWESVQYAMRWACLLLGFDLETTSPERGGRFAAHEAEIVGYSVSWAPGRATYTAGLPMDLSGVLESPAYTKVTHRSGFEYGRLAEVGIQLVNFEDTKMAAWLLQLPSTHLKSLARQILGRDPQDIEETWAHHGLKRGSPELADPDIMREVYAQEYEYGAADADNTRLLWPILSARLEKAGLTRLYRDVEMPLVPVLHEMEAAGVGVDGVGAQKVLAEATDEIRLADEGVYLAGLPRGVNLHSVDQLAPELERMGYPITARTEVKGLLVTDEEHLLEALGKGWNPPLVKALLHTKAMKKVWDYANSYLTLRGPDGRLHPTFIQAGDDEDLSGASLGDAGPVTGRLACRGPNLMNQPNHRVGYEHWAERLRHCLIPTPGWVFVSADISQEEARIAALVTGERVMLKDFQEGRGVYGGFAYGIYNRPITKADGMQWNVAKKSILSFIWGSAGWKPWTERLVVMDPTLTLKGGEEAYARLSRQYPDLAPWREAVRKELVEKGELRDWFGRRRVFPAIYHPDRAAKAGAWREGMNFLIQGPAATVIKLAMRRVYDTLHQQGLSARLLISVHDELVAECPPAEVPQVAAILRTMTSGLMPIELPVEVKRGLSWGAMEVVSD